MNGAPEGAKYGMEGEGMGLIVKDLFKKYGEKVVVDHVSFELPQPGVYRPRFRFRGYVFHSNNRMCHIRIDNLQWYVDFGHQQCIGTSS